MVSSDVVVPALYEAEVVHSRRSPLVHRFAYRTTYWLVDFDKLPQQRGIARWCTGIRRQDHVDIRGFLKDHGVAAARVVMLTGARNFGYTFDPISVFWCFDEVDAQCAVVAEVHNTYGGRHAYLLEFDARGEAQIEKAMPVSPFNETGGTYRIRTSPPTANVLVRVALEREGQEPFVASLRGTRRPLTRTTALVSMLRHSSVRTRTLIQWEALRLWRRGLRVQPR
jgi:DUF1365 family protein